MRIRFEYALVFTIIGCIVGYYTGHHVSSAKTYIDNQIVQGMIEENESSDAEKALRAIKVIEAIDSGQNQKAIHLLTGPIEFYYRIYKPNTGMGGQRRLQVLSKIDELIRTNPNAAKEITNSLAE